jgi:hypothetical protein
MTLDYIITYTDHRGDAQEVRCSSFEDAESIAVFLSDMRPQCGRVTLTDGDFNWMFNITASGG